jgi:epsilon-lactone hydrolase
MRMTAVHGRHDRWPACRVIIEGMDDEGAEVISLQPAPDAIELRHLRSFVAVADELNFGRAAARLYLSQPALSRQISSLERLVGCELLRRSTHRVELTLAGEALLDRARELLRGVDEAVSMTRSVGGSLLARANRHWAQVGLTELFDPVAKLEELRDAFEKLHAQFEPPPGLSVRPVNAGGVAALVQGPRPQEPPTILYLHGGGYVAGSAFGYQPLTGCLADAAGTSVLIADYRLAPEYPFPAAVEDAVRAYLWMVDKGTDPAAITVAGDSAGAGLALSLLLTLKQEGLGMPGGCVLMCPWIDLSPGDLDGLPPELNHVRRLAHGTYLGAHPVDDPLVCPLNADLTGLPPMLVQAATGDPVLDHAVKLVDRAAEHGVDARFELFPVDTHDFHLFWSFLPEAAAALRQAGQFARETRETRAASAAGLHERLGGGAGERGEPLLGALAAPEVVR